MTGVELCHYFARRQNSTPCHTSIFWDDLKILHIYATKLIFLSYTILGGVTITLSVPMLNVSP